MSNLLEKASIITTPTAYDDGRILSVKPNENIYGSELVTNGDFATNSDWTVGSTWTISGGSANCDGGTSNLDQASIVTNTKYKVTVTVSNITTGTLAVRLGGSNVDVLSLTENGTYTGYGLSNGDVFRLRSQSGFDGSVDNVSVVEDLSGDFDFERGSAATRVNAQGLVENVQILSSELVQNGNFSEIGSEEVSNGDFSQEGSELVTNGDFATDSDWTKGIGWSINNGYAVAVSGASTKLTQPISGLSGKTCKVTFTLSDYGGNGSVRVDFGSVTTEPINTNGEHTVYGTYDINIFELFKNSGFSGKIDNVSVVEVGQDWSLSSTFSIEENKLNCVSDGSYQFAYQNNVFTVGKTYKVTFDILDYVSGNIRVRPGGGAIIPISANGSYTLYYTIASGGTQLFVERNSACDMSITNISVKEVLQDWASINANIYLSNNQLVVDDTANLGTDSRAYQTVSTIIGAKYRLTFDRISTTSSFWLAVGSGNPSPYQNIFYQQLGTDTGIYELEFVALTTTTTISLITGGTGISIFDNVSLLQVTDDTDLPRINYEGFSYQDVLGSELITNGSFDTDSDWAKNSNWTISGGAANCDGTSDGSFFQNSVIQDNKQYLVTYTISNLTQGGIKIVLSGSQGILRASNGTYTEYITSGTNPSGRVSFNCSSSPIGSIDNVSVKEYLGQEVVPNSGCGSWLFEPQSTNLVTYSENFSASSWLKSGSSVESGYLSPSEEANASKLTAVNTDPYLSYSVSGVTNLTYSASIYIKGTTSTIGKTARLWIIRDNVVFHSKDFTITDSWQRISTTKTFTTTPTSFVSLRVDLPNTNVSIGDETYIWGAQVEQLSYATSYIPTDGATSTRLRDIANNSGNSDLFNDSEGVLYAEIAALADDGTNRYIGLSDGTISNRVNIFFDTNNVLRAFVSGTSSISSNVDITNVNKVAFKYKSGDIALWVNGLEADTSSSAFSLSGLNDLSFSLNPTSSLKFYGKNKALAVWKEALTDTELELLTAPAPEFPTFTLDFDTIAEQFTFTRGSEATFVNEQGLIQSTNELGTELITNGDFATNSNWQLSTGWTISNGKLRADNASLVNAFQAKVYTSGKTYKVTYTISDFVNGQVRFQLGGGGSTVNGQVRGAGFGGNGTYTEYIVATDNHTSARFRGLSSLGGFTASIDNVSVKEVISATNTPRIDYSTGVEAFLLEPQSTNLITYSEDFSDSSWSKNFISTSKSYIASPKGNANVDLIQTTSASSCYVSAPYLTLVVGSTYAFSCFAKKGNNDWIRMAHISSATNASWFDLENGVVGTVNGISASIEDYGNGWYKCTAVFLAVQSVSSLPVFIGLCSTDGSTNAGASGKNNYIWGAQVEEQSYATSYIPTDGATATRNQETCVDATPTINSEEGVLYAEISGFNNDTISRAISISDGTTSNRINLFYPSVQNQVIGRITSGGTTVADMIYTGVTQTSYNKVAVKWSLNNFALWVNGVEVLSDTSGVVPTGLNEISFDNASSAKFLGNTKGLQVFDKALSDYQLKQLTTI